MKGNNIGYVRVSSITQNTDRQLDTVKLDKVFEEKKSGKNKDRPVLNACLDYLREGDTLHVHSIDRLARNLMDLEKIVDGLIKKAVTVQFHKENLIFHCDSENPMSTLMLQMMGAFAQFERSMIRERQLEGIAKAMEKNVVFGRKPVLAEAQIMELKEKIKNGDEKKALAKEYGISRQTLYRHAVQKKTEI